jgi:FkbM family methyltransferase
MLKLTKKILKKAFYRIGVNPYKWLPRANPRGMDEIEVVSQLFERKKSGVMFDVGFAWGHASFPFLLKGWRSFGFEPDNSTSKLNSISEFRSIFPKLVFSNKAVSNRDGLIESFFTSAESEGISSLHSFKDHKLSHQVTTVSLASVVKTNSIDSIDFLKIDVEGHDFQALQSLDFNQIVPTVILIEFDDFKTKPLGYDHVDLGEFLVHHGYLVYMFEWFPIVKYGQQHRFRRINQFPCSMVDSKGWGNFLAIQPEQELDLNKLLRSKFSQYLET